MKKSEKLKLKRKINFKYFLLAHILTLFFAVAPASPAGWPIASAADNTFDADQKSVYFKPFLKLVEFLNEKKNEMEKYDGNFKSIKSFLRNNNSSLPADKADLPAETARRRGEEAGSANYSAELDSASSRSFLSYIIESAKKFVKTETGFPLNNGFLSSAVFSVKDFFETSAGAVKNFVFPGNSQNSFEYQSPASLPDATGEEMAQEIEALKRQYAEAIDKTNAISQKFNLLQNELGKIKNSGAVVSQPSADQRALESTIEIIEKIISGQSASSGFSQNDLDSKISEIRTELNDIDANLTSQINNLSSNTSRQTSAAFSAISLTNRIDSLSGTRLSNITVSGVSGLTDSDIPDTVTASGYLSLAGGTLTGALTGTSASFSSTLTVSASTTLNGVEYKWPSADGTANQALVTNGAGGLSWTTISGGSGSGASADWNKQTNYGVLTLTPTTTIPIWAKDAFYASSTSVFQGLATFGNASTSFLTVSNGAWFTGGNVGIGTTTPNWNLQIASSTKTRLALSDMSAGTNDKHWLLSSMGGNFYIGTSTDALNATSTYLTINNRGYVGIGTTSPFDSSLTVTNKMIVSNNQGLDSGLYMDSGQGSYGLIQSINAANTSTKNLVLQSWGGNVGIGTTSPYAKLTVWGGGTSGARIFEAIDSASTTVFSISDNGLFTYGKSATSTIPSNTNYAWSIATSTTASPIFSISTLGSGANLNATTTINGGLNLDSGAILYDYSSGVTTINSLEAGPMSFDNDAGIVTAFDLPIVSAATGTVESYSFNIAASSTPNLTVYGEAVWQGVQNQRIGIGTTTPWRTLSVNGTVGFSSSLSATTTNANDVCIDVVTFEITRRTTDCSGASSLRYKQNVEKLSYGLEDIMKLNPVSFQYTEAFAPTDRTRKIGFIAEEVALLIPEVVAYDDWGRPDSLDYPKFTSLLAKAIQELNIKISDLQASVATSSTVSSEPSLGLFSWIVNKFMTTLGIVFEQDRIKAKNICVGETCVTEDQFKAVFGSAQLASSASSQSSTFSAGSSSSNSSSSAQITSSSESSANSQPTSSSSESFSSSSSSEAFSSSQSSSSSAESSSNSSSLEASSSSEASSSFESSSGQSSASSEASSHTESSSEPSQSSASSESAI